MDSRLFRSEVLHSRTNQWTGSIVLARPIPLRAAAFFSILLLTALGFFLATSEYTRRVRVTGNLVPTDGAIRVVAPQFGRVLARLVKEGDVTTVGHVMFELGAERSGQGGDLDQRIEESLASRRDLMTQEEHLQTQQLRRREQSLLTRQALGQAEIDRLAQECKLQDARIASAEDIYKRYMTLRQQSFVSELQFRQIENDYNEQLARRQTLERSVLTAQRDLLQLQEDAQEIDGQIHLSGTQAARNLASLEQEMAEHQGRSRIQVLAPISGTVTALPFEPGQSVQAGGVLGTILPAGSKLEAHLMVPSRAIGFVETGQHVLLRMAAFPYQKFGSINGVILRAERSPIGGSNDVSVAPGPAEPVYRVVVKLEQQGVVAYGREQPFKAGMTLEADIHQDRRRLIEWIVDPILSFGRNRTG